MVNRVEIKSLAGSSMIFEHTVGMYNAGGGKWIDYFSLCRSMFQWIEALQYASYFFCV